MVPREDSRAVTRSRPPPHLDLAEVHARDELYQPVHTAADGSLHYSTALAAGYAQARHDDPRGKRRNCGEHSASCMRAISIKGRRGVMSAPLLLSGAVCLISAAAAWCHVAVLCCVGGFAGVATVAVVPGANS